MRRVLFLALVVAAALAALVKAGELGIGPIVVTREDEQKLILLLQNPRDKATKPGLSFRIPILEEVRTFDRRWLHMNAQPESVKTVDRVDLVVDNYVIWRISDPLAFYRHFPTGHDAAEQQIGREVAANLREVLGRHSIPEILTEKRDAIMAEIKANTSKALENYGIEVRDVRLNRTELPEKVEENVYARMSAEREALARKARAEGEEQARSIRAEADRQARVLIGQARESSERVRGQGDAESARVYADAYSRDPGFYAFVRSLEAYRKTLGEGTTLVLPPGHEFFRVLDTGGSDLKPTAPPPAPVAAPPPATGPAPSPAPAPAIAPVPSAGAEGTVER
jgi:modulator of FtsH protease HflC